MADELSLIEVFLYSTLSGDGILTGLLATQPATIGNPGIFNGSVKQGAVFPVVLFRWVSPEGDGDTYVNGWRRSWTRAKYEVGPVAQRSDYGSIKPIADRIDTLLSIRVPVSVTGGKIVSCVRDFPARLPSVELGQEYRQSSGFWIIMAQSV